MNTNLPLTNFYLESEHSVPEYTDLQYLSKLLSRYAPHNDHFYIPKTNIQIVRSSHTDIEKTYMLSLPSVCIVPQGCKMVNYGKASFEYGETTMVVYAAQVPLKVNVTKASEDTPYLCMVIPIEPSRIHDLMLKVFPNGFPKSDNTRAVYVGKTQSKIIKSAIRMMEFIEQQESVDLLVPLMIDEILIRLLRSPAGAAIAQIGIQESHTSKINKAIDWINEHFMETIKIEELAKLSGMSVSAFHTHFKKITTLSPLQFQKIQRLEKARELIRKQMADISSTAFKVGYMSPTQFSREYRRYFGIAPSKDGVVTNFY